MYTVTALYKFVSVDDIESLQQSLYNFCEPIGIKGTLLVANEGLNGTIAGEGEAIAKFLQFLKSDPRFSDIDHKESFAKKMPFLRLKVRLKKEIVTIGVPEVDPNKMVGTYVEPKDWNALIEDPEVLLIDTRNDYEVEVGTFKGAINPNTKSFREFPEYIKQNFDPKHHKRVAMMCTGGIRCEKASSYMIGQGFEEVYHLKGGILKYLEQIPEEKSLWDGECFVFDERVTVGHGLKPGHYDQCHGCRRPISDEDKQSEKYERGVSCPKCFEEKSMDRKNRYRNRQVQIDLAKQRGEKHLGVTLPSNHGR